MAFKLRFLKDDEKVEMPEISPIIDDEDNNEDDEN